MGRRWLMGALVVACAVGAPGICSAAVEDAIELGDFSSSDLLDVPNPLDADIADVFAVDIFDPSDFMDFISCSLFGSCGGAPKMKDFHVRRRTATQVWQGNGAHTSGKLMVNMEKQFGFDTDTDDAAEVWTSWNNVWRWRAKKKGEYYKATYTLSESLTPVTQLNSGKLSASLTGSAVPNTNSQAPKSYTAAAELVPAAWTLRDLRFVGHHTNVSPYGLWVNGNLISFASKKWKAKAILRNAAGTRQLVRFKMGKITAKSHKANGKYYNQIVYRAWD